MSKRQKEVQLFVGEIDVADKGSIVVQATEVRDARWMTFLDASRSLTYKEDQDVWLAIQAELV